MTAKSQEPSPFWTFSLRLYARPGVPPACLALQNGAGVDVNVMLFGLFLADAGRGLGPADIAAVMGVVEAWKANVVVPLRRVRTWLKSPPAAVEAAGASALRDRIKASELEAERLQQEALFAAFPLASIGAPQARDIAARDNLLAYQTHLGVAFDADAVGIILAAFATIEETAT
jgi:uncharacterized protein (TIGR02444 family)